MLLPKHVSHVVGDSTALQQRQKLLLETTLAMMGFLVPDIRLHRFDLRRTHTECSISFLPGKPGPNPEG